MYPAGFPDLHSIAIQAKDGTVYLVLARFAPSVMIRLAPLASRSLALLHSLIYFLDF